MTRPGNPPRGSSSDLRSSATAAAIELDNILLGRRTKTAAITHLIDILQSGVPDVEQRTTSMALITPTVVVMDRVVRHAKPSALLTEVIKEYDSILERLIRVASAPDLANFRHSEPHTLADLRGVCLAISRYASSLRRPPSSAPKNARRR